MCSLLNKRALWVFALFMALPAAAQLPPIVDTVSRSVIVERIYNKPMVINSTGISGTVNTEKIAAIPSFLGNADPLRFVRLLPSVQTNTEIEAGIYMQGSEHSHTLVSQAGVPIYGVSHLLGLFSVFNTPHYQGMQYSTTSRQETRMGGMVNMELPDTVSRRWGGDFSLGLLNAQGTLDIPLGASSLKLSARRTYVNLLYGSFLKYAEYPIRYGFSDVNATWTWKPGKRDKIWADFFACLDDGSVSGATIKTVNAHWYNALGALHWNHYFPGVTMKQSAYASTFGMQAQIDAFNIYGQLPSFIRDYGYRNTVEWKDWEFGARYHHAVGLVAAVHHNAVLQLALRAQHAFDGLLQQAEVMLLQPLVEKLTRDLDGENVVRKTDGDDGHEPRRICLLRRVILDDFKAFAPYLIMVFHHVFSTFFSLVFGTANI